MVRKGTRPASTSRSGGIVVISSLLLRKAKATMPLAAVAGGTSMPRSSRKVARTRSGTRPVWYSRFSDMNAHSWSSVIPGSLSLWLRHSGLCTGMRAVTSASSSR